MPNLHIVQKCLAEIYFVPSATVNQINNYTDELTTCLFCRLNNARNCSVKMLIVGKIEITISVTAVK